MQLIIVSCDSVESVMSSLAPSAIYFGGLAGIEASWRIALVFLSFLFPLDGLET
jgi:hypothetical protein